MKVLKISCLLLLISLIAIQTKIAFDLYEIRHNTVSAIMYDTHNFQHQLAVKESLRKYRYVLNQPEIKVAKQNPYPDKVWILWTDGFDKLPEVVQVCIDSMKKHITDHEIIFVDMNNLSKYVEIPDYILEKYKKGIISHAHFADIVRIFLLREYGGLWMDTSTFLSGKIPEWIWNSDFCAPHFIEMEKIVSPNFDFKNKIFGRVFDIDFMRIKHPHNYVIDCMARFLEEYWKEHNECDYPFAMMFQAVTVEEDQKFREICQEMLRRSSFSTKTHDLLWSKIVENKRFKAKTWTRLKQFPIHKIHGVAQISKMKFKEGTYGYKLLNGELSEHF